jgi:hypothetical protein
MELRIVARRQHSLTELGKLQAWRIDFASHAVKLGGLGGQKSCPAHHWQLQ